MQKPYSYSKEEKSEDESQKEGEIKQMENFQSDSKVETFIDGPQQRKIHKIRPIQKYFEHQRNTESSKKKVKIDEISGEKAKMANFCCHPEVEKTTDGGS